MTNLRLLRTLALYARCRVLAREDFSIEIVEFTGACAGETGILRWRVGHAPDSQVRCRGVSMTATDGALLRALKDAHLFLRRTARSARPSMNQAPEARP